MNVLHCVQEEVVMLYRTTILSAKNDNFILHIRMHLHYPKDDVFVIQKIIFLCLHKSNVEITGDRSCVVMPLVIWLSKFCQHQFIKLVQCFFRQTFVPKTGIQFFCIKTNCR